jgi:hypothetical protein
MTQDIIVTIIAMGTVAGFAVRWWRRRGRQESTCASCESNGPKSPVRVQKGPAPIDPSGSEIKPVAFFGGSGKRRIH